MSWDHDSPEVLGKIVLVGVTWVADDGRVQKRGQWWGRIVAFNLHDGLKIRLADGEQTHAFAPFEDGLRSADPGVYRLSTTGEEIANPDYLYTIQCKGFSENEESSH
jgi:hypothetical protein